jgi:hypothetical protein
MPRAGPEKAAAAVTARYWFLWGALSGLPHHTGRRPPHARSPPRRGGDKPHPGAVVSLVPAARAVRLVRLSRTSIAARGRWAKTSPV